MKRECQGTKTAQGITRNWAGVEVVISPSVLMGRGLRYKPQFPDPEGADTRKRCVALVSSQAVSDLPPVPQLQNKSSGH